MIKLSVEIGRSYQNQKYVPFYKRIEKQNYQTIRVDHKKTKWIEDDKGNIYQDIRQEFNTGSWLRYDD